MFTFFKLLVFHYLFFFIWGVGGWVGLEGVNFVPGLDYSFAFKDSSFGIRLHWQHDNFSLCFRF
jgi:hypothetical protein